MIRTRKAVRLLEWGEGTNTTNQIWTVSGEGKIVRQKKIGPVTTVWLELNEAFSKKNTKDNTIKLAQLGEGMAANSERWGEVAVGLVKSVENGGRTVQIEIPTAAKFDNRKTVPAWEENYS